MPAPRVSIVVVNWNTRALLLRLLGQLLPPAGPVLAAEILVVDNHSDDDSVAAARAAFPAARVLPQPRNGGFAFGVNRGLEQARGDWILLLNTDTEVSGPALERFLADAEASPGPGVFGPRIVDEHGVVQASTWTAHRPLRCLLDALGFTRLQTYWPPPGPCDVDCVSGCVFLIRRAALERVGGMDERFFLYFEEADLCERVRRAGFTVRYLPAASFMHAGGLSAGQAAVRTFLAFRESRLLYHAGWHGRIWTEWVRACLLLGSLLRLCLLAPVALAGRADRLRLHASALRFLARPALVRELCARPRQVARVEPRPTGVAAASG